MKNLLKIALLTILLASAGTAYADNTGTQVIERIQLTPAGTVYFRPAGLQGWGGQGCPEARFAYLGNDAPEFDNIISLAVASKLNGTPVQFLGTCTPDGNYILITYKYLT